MEGNLSSTDENRLMWCIECNISYMESDLTKLKVCPKCNNDLSIISMNYSKEIIVAFDFDKKRIDDTIRKQFGP